MNFIFSIAILITLSATSHAANSSKYYSKLKFIKLDDNELVKVEKFNSIAKDGASYFWFANNGSFLQYNGYKIHSIKKKITLNSPKLIDHSLVSVKYNIKTGLWFASNYALTNYKNNQFIPIVRTDEVAARYINNDAVLKKYGGLPNDSPSSIYISPKGNIWLAMRDRIIELTPGTNRVVNHIPWQSITDNSLSKIEQKSVVVLAIHEDQRGYLWLSTRKRGIVKYHPKTKKTVIYKGQLTDDINLNKVTGIIELDNDKLLITSDIGLLTLDIKTETFKRYPAEKPITEPINAIHKSLEGSVWIGGQNVYHLQPDTQKIIQYNQALDFGIQDQESLVGALYADEQGTVLIAYNNVGVFRANNSTSKIQIINDIIPQDLHVRLLKPGFNNTFWIAFSSGLYRAIWRNNTLETTHIKRENGSDFDRVRDIYLSNNTTWVIDNNSISVIKKDNSVITYSIPDNLLNGKAGYSLVEDYLGNIWFSVIRNGIFKFNPKAQLFTREGALEQEQLHTWFYTGLQISQNRKKLLYFKSSSGFGEFDIQSSTITKAYTSRKVIQDYEKTLLLRDDSAWRINQEKNSNKLWITHAETFISWYDAVKDEGQTIDTPMEEAVHAIVLDEAKNQHWLLGEKNSIGLWNKNTNEFTLYTENDGIPNTGINWRAQGVVTQEKVFFGSKKGLLIVDRNQKTLNPYLPETTISHINVNYKPYIFEHNQNQITPIHLKHDQNILSFQFFGTSTANPELNQYRYRLKGLYDDWQDAAPGERKALFTNLDPGDYVFEVISSNNDGIWGNQIAQVKISIIPAWWASPIAYVIYFILSALLIMLGYHFRIKSIQRKNQQLQMSVNEKTSEIKGLLDFKNHFILDLTHELKTMLQIQSNEYQTLFTFLNENPGFNPKRLDNSNKKMVRIIDQLLHLAKLQTSEKQPTETFDCAALLHLTIPLFDHFAQEMKVKLEIDVPENGLLIHANRNALERIFTNLIGNAIKYNRANGSVNISAFADNEKIIIKIRDTGDGIAQEKLPNSFQYASKQSPHSKQPIITNNKSLVSHGVGLHLVEKLITMNHGYIKVDTSKGVGTTFTLSFRQSEYTQAQRLLPSDIDKQMVTMETTHHENSAFSIDALKAQLVFDEKRETILLIDDHGPLLQSVTPHLNQQFNLLLAVNGEEGLQLAQEHCPDIIITDLNMPIMDGFEVIRQVKASHSLGHIPVILLTAISNEGTQIQGLQLGADDVIFKPATPLEITQKVTNRLETNRRLWKKYLEATPENTGLRESKKTPKKASTPLEIEETHAQAFLDELHHYVNTHLSEPKQLRVPIIAKKMGLPERLMSTKLRQITGASSVTSYLKDYRLTIAHQRLSSEPIGKIEPLAMELGFSFYQFSRSYKEKYGESPSDTRAKFQASKL